MRKLFIIAALCLTVTGCAPVLDRDTMKEGIRTVSFAQLRQTPDAYKGKLFILGGLIVDTKFMEKGSQIEALYIPVNSYGYLIDEEHRGGRFLAVYPRSKGLLDPLIYKKGREITLSGEFLETRKGKIDEMEYEYPVFEIKEIYLWEEQKDYYPPYYPYYSRPFVYDPWGRPYPNPYPYYPAPPWY